MNIDVASTGFFRNTTADINEFTSPLLHFIQVEGYSLAIARSAVQVIIFLISFSLAVYYHFENTRPTIWCVGAVTS